MPLLPRSISLEITVFVCGAVVMVFEIIGSRVVAPFIGASTYIWTSLIGVILASLSVGYWLGGRAADKHPETRWLAAVIFGAGGLIGVTVLVKDIVLSAIASASFSLELKAMAASVLLFAPACVCLGCVAPFATRLKLADVEKTGATVGRLYALSTAGSISGTFLAGFYLIPFVGSIRTLYAIGAILLVLSALLFPLKPTKVNIAAIAVFVLGIVASESNAYLLREKADMYDIDAEYSRVRVFSTNDVATGRPITALATDPFTAQSAIFKDSDELVFDYAKYYHLVRHFKPDFKETLIIGGAGYTFPMDYLRTYPEAKIDVVEIDPGMTAIARRFFRMKDDPRMQIIHQDGRMFLNQAPSEKYDAVFVDAFNSLFNVPFHLTTLEAVQQIHRTLKPDGVAILNLGSALTGDGNQFFHSEMATYRSVFPGVKLFKIHSECPATRLQNLIIVAVKSSEDFRPRSTDPFIANLLDHDQILFAGSQFPVLTDDVAPVEYYNSTAQKFYQNNR